ncbi:MAG TPA: PilN domain-containing protein [Vicinamibacterales bacterium]|nr:PilN domain-containing protein [Vicinamibacterales bacterium]
MIRINLLAVERQRTRKARVAIPTAHRVTVGASLILLATVLGVAWWFLALRERSRALDQELARAEAETQQLRSVLAQVQKFEARKAQLQQRVTIIEELRKGQLAPVRVLDEISRSLPERLWLTEMKQTGSDFALSGITTNLNALSDFVANLEATKWFRRPVEIVDSQVEANPKVGDLVKFSVKATFSDPSSPAKGATPPAKPGGAARGAR